MLNLMVFIDEILMINVLKQILVYFKFNIQPQNNLFQGITENITINGETLTNWKHTGFPLNNISELPTEKNVQLPAFFSGRFQLPDTLDTAFDTFVDMTGWAKVIYSNLCFFFYVKFYQSLDSDRNKII